MTSPKVAVRLTIAHLFAKNSKMFYKHNHYVDRAGDKIFLRNYLGYNIMIAG